jgi:steroid 5-alpha reductase family enzyme
MNIILTAIILIFTILTVPYVILNYTEPISTLQYDVLLQVIKTVLIPVTAAVWVVGVLTRNVSQVDKLWSIIPVVYCYCLSLSIGLDQRTLLMLIGTTIWVFFSNLNFRAQD